MGRRDHSLGAIAAGNVPSVRASCGPRWVSRQRGPRVNRSPRQERQAGLRLRSQRGVRRARLAVRWETPGQATVLRDGDNAGRAGPSRCADLGRSRKKTCVRRRDRILPLVAISARHLRSARRPRLRSSRDFDQPVPRQRNRFQRFASHPPQAQLHRAQSRSPAHRRSFPYRVPMQPKP